jgi:hypothetical protein
MAPETEAACLFCATAFFWMGVNLLLGAPEHAGSALAWMAGEGQVDISQRRRLTFLYRCAGAVWAGFGLWLLWQTLRRPASLVSWLPHQRLSTATKVAGGFLFLLCGSFLAAVKAAAPTSTSSSNKAARTWGWVIVLAFLAFGAFLISRAGGHHA